MTTTNFFMISIILFLFTLLPMAILTNIVILPVIAIALSLSFIAIYLTKFNNINKEDNQHVL